MVQYKQSGKLLSFMGTLPLGNDGTILYNPLVESIPNESDFFAPTYTVTAMATQVHSLINQEGVFERVTTLEPPEEVEAMRTSPIKYTDNRLYTLLQSIVLESFATLYAIDNDELLLDNIDSSDMENIHNSINYAIEELGKLPGYSDVILFLRQCNSDILYVLSRAGGNFNAL